jgi:transposase
MECAWGAVRTKESAFCCRFWHLKGMKKHHKRVIIVVARKMLTIIWTLLSTKQNFDKEYHLKKKTV